MKKFIIPSLIATNPDQLKERFDKVKDIAELFQLDVMDGEFVANTSLEFDIKLDEEPTRFEAHLMMLHPEEWIEQNYDKANIFLFHFERCENIDKVLQLSGSDKKIGIALNPETPLSALEDFLDKLDQVLIMTVYPGGYGAEFLPEMLEKVRKLRAKKPELDIEVDGGITFDTLKLAHEAGANKFVSGSYLMKAENVGERMKKMMDHLEQNKCDHCKGENDG